jgi:hypothetical protein
MKLYAAFRAATLSVPAAASADYLGKVIDRSIGTIDQAMNGGFLSNWYAFHFAPLDAATVCHQVINGERCSQASAPT